MDIIRIHCLELDCIVGTRPQEREREQRVRIDLRLFADLAPAARTGRISLTTDYDQVAHEIAALLSFRRYHLIEMAAEEVCAMLLGLHRGVERVELRIEKPGALEGRARAASVELRRSREHFPSQREAQPYGERELLLETREAELELVHVAPGEVLVAPLEPRAPCLYWLASGTLESEGGRALEVSLPDGATLASSDGWVPLRNPAPDPACLFRCWRLP